MGRLYHSDDVATPAKIHATKSINSRLFFGFCCDAYLPSVHHYVLGRPLWALPRRRYSRWTTYQWAGAVDRLQISIPKWTELAGWPKEKVFLTFQVDSAAGTETSEPHHEVIRFLAQEVQDKGYAGMLGWPSSPGLPVQNPSCTSFSSDLNPAGFGVNGFEDPTQPSDQGCCEAICDRSVGAAECTEQQATFKDACESRSLMIDPNAVVDPSFWTWKEDGEEDVYTCCRCAEACR